MSISLSGGGIFPGINVRKSEKNMVSCFYTKFNKTLFIYFFAFISVFDTIFHLATEERAYGLGRATRPPSTPTESAENRRAQRRRRPGQPPRNPASNSHGRLRSGVDLFARASRGHIVEFTLYASAWKAGLHKGSGFIHIL